MYILTLGTKSLLIDSFLANKYSHLSKGKKNWSNSEIENSYLVSLKQVLASFIQLEKNKQGKRNQIEGVVFEKITRRDFQFCLVDNEQNTFGSRSHVNSEFANK